jgi:hypothetical protein
MSLFFLLAKSCMIQSYGPNELSDNLPNHFYLFYLLPNPNCAALYIPLLKIVLLFF